TWTAGKLKEFGLRHFLGAHCTGIEAVYHIRRQAGLDRQSCVVGAVGSSFTLDKGIDPLSLAR
ncbi:MAG: MBL fold metallo-hydrolase, partial [Blastocatellia bacterium]